MFVIIVTVTAATAAATASLNHNPINPTCAGTTAVPTCSSSAPGSTVKTILLNKQTRVLTSNNYGARIKI